MEKLVVHHGHQKDMCYRMVTSHTRLRAHDHYTLSTLIGGKGIAGPSSLYTMLEGPAECANARWV